MMLLRRILSRLRVELVDGLRTLVADCMVKDRDLLLNASEALVMLLKQFSRYVARHLSEARMSISIHF